MRRQKNGTIPLCVSQTHKTHNCLSGNASGRKLINSDKRLYSINPSSRIILVAWAPFVWPWQRLISLDESLFQCFYRSFYCAFDWNWMNGLFNQKPNGVSVLTIFTKFFLWDIYRVRAFEHR